MKTNRRYASEFRKAATARRAEKPGDFAADRNFDYYRDKSLADDLIGTEYCKFESRLALRSTEIQLLFYDLFINPPADLSLLGL